MTSGPTRHQIEEMAEQARRDLADLDAQVREGELDEGTARDLRSTYLRDLEEASRRLAEHDHAAEQAPKRSRGRLVAGAAILAVGLGLAVGLVGSFVQERDDGVLQGAAAEDFDPADYSNETLEAVIAQAETEPALAQQIQAMRFALAERYFEEGDYDTAFGHYRIIVESEPPPALASASLTRIAWIVWVGNGLTDLALDTIDRALEVAPGNTEASYVKAQILWCGLGDPAAAVPLLESIAGADGITDDVRAQVEEDLALASSGESCS